MATTIRDVANHAGVALSTVSYVLTGNRPVSRETRHRVQRSIEELRFRPHAGARSVRASRTGVIGLVVPFRAGASSRVRMDFVSAVVEAANRRHLDVLLVTAVDGEAQITRVVESAMVDGLVVMDVDLHDPRIPLLAELGKPAVLIGMPDQAAGVAYVDLDFAEAGRLCARHLLELGHERIALLGCPQSFFDHELAFVHRFRSGVREVLHAGGAPEIFEAVEPWATGLEDALFALLRREPELTGLVVHNDTVVGRVVDTLKRSFREVPRDISVVAMCPDELALQQHPQLAFVGLPAADLGARAVEMLVAQDGGTPVASELLVPELHAGTSTSVSRCTVTTAGVR